MKHTTRLLLVPALALGVAVGAAGPAFAATEDATYQTTLEALNGSGATGSYTVKLVGDQATVTGEVSGLAETFNDAPYPHVQHIHIAAQGVCPPADADTNGDGVIDTPEGQPFYGEIGTTLSLDGATDASTATDLTVAPSGSSFTFERTFTMNAATIASLKAGTGVIVVHGLDPAGLSQAAQDAMSSLVPELPLAATAPALCGALAVSQMEEMPEGGVQTGGVNTSGPDLGMLALGGGLLLAAGGVVAVRRRVAARN
ncbi:hypothetical protein [Marisediminicola antarctica]|uniref:CHRD domain-containing protein n=1 Tax=Marisediminicola antarctica TaxID=674079 RepID=A0A7L5AHD1_9MICO|nr:hypothetical protein [Marisediminicola antarctica]QHO69436.1 hypothetical protein BHD05_07060 [Marisediminicola antarctica]